MPIDLTAPQLYNQFVAFAQSAKSRTIIGEFNGVKFEAKKKWDFIGNIGRGEESRNANDDIRASFMSAVTTMFGVSKEDDLPETVKSAMRLDDYRKGKPLTARRIITVKQAVDQHIDAIAATTEERARILGVPADETFRNLIRTAVATSISDKDTLEIVMAGIKGIVMTGSGFPRSAAEIKTLVVALSNNVAELRQLANGDKRAFEAGKRCLCGTGGIPVTLPRGVLAAIFQDADLSAQMLTAGGVPLQQALNTGGVFENAKRLFSSTIAAMIRHGNLYANDAEGNFGPNAAACCRNLMLGILLIKGNYSDDCIENLRKDMKSPSASELKRTCLDMAALLRTGGDTSNSTLRRLCRAPQGERLYMAEAADMFSNWMDQLTAALDTCCGASESARCTILPSDTAKRWESDSFYDYIARLGRVEMSEQRRQFLSTSVIGDGASADLARYVLARKVDQQKPYGPIAAMQNTYQDVVKGLLRRQIASSETFAQSGPTAENRTGIAIFLPRNVKLSDNMDMARDQLAATIMRREGTRYADLPPKDRNKVHIAMALLSRGMIEAAFLGPALALNMRYNPKDGNLPDGTVRPAIIWESDSALDRHEISLEFDVEGNMNLAVHAHKRLTAMHVLKDDGNSYASAEFQTGTDGRHPGSSLSVAYMFSVKAQALERITATGDFNVSDEDVTCCNFTMTPTLHDKQPMRSIFPMPWNKLEPPAPGEPDPIGWRDDPGKKARDFLELVDGLGPRPELKDEFNSSAERDSVRPRHHRGRSKFGGRGEKAAANSRTKTATTAKMPGLIRRVLSKIRPEDKK